MRRTLYVSILAFVISSAAFADTVRTFVAPTGSDTNPCSLAAPCRTLQVAVNAVDAGGEVVVLGSAGYGAVDTAKSISIIAPTGVHAGISVTSGVAIHVGGDKVVLRGLTLSGLGPSTGIYGSGSALHIENCVLSGFGNAITASSLETFIEDTLVRNNDTGISVGNMAGGKASIDHVRALDNRIGIRTDTCTTTTVRDSVASGNSDNGFLVFTGTGPQAVLNLENCMASNNTTGIEERFSMLVISNCTVTGNTTVGVTGNGGFIYSRKNNTVYNNASDVDAAVSTLPPA
jgi:hypothetical protein